MTNIFFNLNLLKASERDSHCMNNYKHFDVVCSNSTMAVLQEAPSWYLSILNSLLSPLFEEEKKYQTLMIR